MYKTIAINKQNKIKILDQRKLPFKTRYIITDNYKIVIKAIKNLSVRGAPAIGVAGGFVVPSLPFEVHPFLVRCLSLR